MPRPTIVREPEVDEPMGMRWTIGRVLAVVASLAMVAFWAWIFAGGPRKANPDRIDDRAFVEAAKVRCDQLRDDLETLPNAVESETAAERATVLERANAMVADMVSDLKAKAPTTGPDGERVQPWLGDWETYLKDREDYAVRLRTETNPRFNPSENHELHAGVDETIEVFADVNDMPQCATPGDVG